MDDPDKAQYSPYDIVGFGGIDLSPLTKIDDRTKTELVSVIYDMVNPTWVQVFLPTDGPWRKKLVIVSWFLIFADSYSLWQTYLGSKAQKRVMMPTLQEAFVKMMRHVLKC